MAKLPAKSSAKQPIAPAPVTPPLPQPTHPLVLRDSLRHASREEEAAWQARTGGADVDTLLKRIEETEGLLGEREALGILDHPDERVLSALVLSSAWGGSAQHWGGRQATVLLPWLWNRVVAKMRADGVDWSELANLVGERLYESSGYERTWRRTKSDDPDAIPEAFTTDGQPFPQVWFAERNDAFTQAQSPDVWAQLLEWNPPTVKARMARHAPTMEPDHVRALVESGFGETLLRNPGVTSNQDLLYVIFRWAMEQMNSDSGLSSGALLAQQVLARGLKTHGRLQRALDTRRKRSLGGYHTGTLDPQPAWLLWLQPAVGVEHEQVRKTVTDELPNTASRALLFAMTREDLWTPAEALNASMRVGQRWIGGQIADMRKQGSYYAYHSAKSTPNYALEKLERISKAPLSAEHVPAIAWQGLALRADAWADAVVGPLLAERLPQFFQTAESAKLTPGGRAPEAFTALVLHALDTPQLLDRLLALSPEFRARLLGHLLSEVPDQLSRQLLEHIVEGGRRWQALVEKPLIRQLLLHKEPEMRRMGTALMTMPKEEVVATPEPVTGPEEVAPKASASPALAHAEQAEKEGPVTAPTPKTVAPHQAGLSQAASAQQLGLDLTPRSDASAPEVLAPDPAPTPPPSTSRRPGR